MNSIPTTFDENQISTTIIGGNKDINEGSLNISVILLASGTTHQRQQVFENLLTCNFASIVCVEKNTLSYGMDEVTKKFPQIKFIYIQEECSDGEKINIAMAEISSEYAFVLRDSINIPSGFILSHLAERLTKNSIYCVAPRLIDCKKNSLPCSNSPHAEKSRFIIDSSTAVEDGKETLYPYDYIGIYHRQKFIQLGGFDYTIKSPYWQNLDLAVRAWLWGEKIKVTTLLQLNYIEDPVLPDQTLNMDYLRFYLKNQLPKYKNEIGIIKRASFFVFFFNSSCGLFEAKRQFTEARKWVNTNRFKFKTDLQTLITNWSTNENK